MKEENAMEKRKEAFHQGRTLGISGREMFLFNPEMVGEYDEDEEEGGTVFDMVRQEVGTVCTCVSIAWYHRVWGMLSVIKGIMCVFSYML